MKKSLMLVSILLIVLIGLGTVSAEENVIDDVDMTLGDSNRGTPVYVDNWADLESYCESPNDQIVYLNGSFSIGSQIQINNNVNIIGDTGYYIGGTADNVDTYSSVPFLCSDALNVTFTNVNFQYGSGKYLMQFSGNGNYNLDNCNFDNLNSGTDNSIIWSNYGIINVNNCSFSDCTVKTGVINNYYAANAATFNNARLYVADSRFINNNASSHSGAIANTGYLVVENTIFDGNNATSWAGAIHTAAYANTSIYDSTFSNNVAGWNGGALYAYCNLQIYNSTFIGNNCTTNNGGGAIGACKVFTEPNVYIVDSYFENNFNNCTQYSTSSTTSLGRGGAISIMDDGSLKVYNNTFIGNDAVIGTAICAISQGSYGSPDVEIVGNNFTNQTSSIGSDLLIISLSNSNYLVENNTYSNNNISVGKFRLDIDDNDGLVTVNVTLRLKHAEDYDSDIVTKSGFDVYVDNVYNKTVYDTTFTLNFADSVNHNVKVVPLCLAGVSASKNINDANYNTIYVSTTGSDNNNGTSRDYAVRTISKAIELASTVDYIKILEGTYYERGLTVSNVTIEGEGNVVLDGSASSANTFIVDASVIFKNLQFTGIASNSAISITSETGNDYLITVSNCSFYSNNVAGKLINAKNLNIEDSTICDNVVQYAIYSTGNLNIENCNMYNNNLTTSSSSSNAIVSMAAGNVINSSFNNNQARQGIIRISGSDVSIKESNFINNVASSNGGAIYVNSANDINIISSIFYNNKANSRGGAIYLANSNMNLNVTNSVLIDNTASLSRNYQIDRAGIKPNIYAINNWWGNTIDNAYTVPTFYSNTNVNASIWLILNVTSNVTSLSSGESALITFDLTYTNILGSDAPNGTNITGNLTPFCIDGVDLPALEGVLTATNGDVNATIISFVDGKASVLFTATSTNPYLTINLLGKSESIYFDNGGLLLLNNLNKISIEPISEISSIKFSSRDLLSYGYNPDEYEELTEDIKWMNLQFIIYSNCCVVLPSYDTTEVHQYWMGDDDWMDYDDNGLPEEWYDGDDNFCLNISYFNSTTGKWEEVITDSYHMPFPGYDAFRTHSKCRYYVFNFTRGLYNISYIYDGQVINYQWEDEETSEVYDAEYVYNEDSWIGGILDISSSVYSSNINGINSMVFYEGNTITINPSIKINPVSELPYVIQEDSENLCKVMVYNSKFDFKTIGGYDALSDIEYNPVDFPENKPVNITITITQGKNKIENFSVAPGDSYSLDNLTAGEYNLTAVYDDPYYGHATKTVSLTVNKNIWENVGADEGYSHQTDYFGPKNVEELWNLSISDNYFNLNDNFQPSVIDCNGNVYVVNGTKILVVNSDGDVIKTLTIESEEHTGLFSKGLALYNNYLICSVYNSAMYGASVWDISNNYAHSCFPSGGWGEVGDKKSTTSYYPPVVADGKVYISSWQFYSDKDHIYEWTTNTHSNSFPRSTGAPSVDSNGYIYVNTKSGLVVLGPELNILDLSFGDAGKYGRPVIDSEDMVYVFNADRTIVYSLNREKGLEWNTTISGGACGVMAVDVENNALYIVGNDGILYKLNRGIGEMSEFYNLGTTASSILVDKRGSIYLGGDDGVLYAVSNEGKTLFKYNIGSPITKDIVLDDKGTLYVYADTKLYALTGAPRLYSEISINVSDAEVNRNNTIVATLPEDATGNVTFIIDDTINSENVPIINGNATWTAPGLLSGPHTVKVTWIGDSEYFGSEATAEFNAYKVNSNIDLEDSINYVGKLTQLNITLPSDANGTVNVTFNRKTETVKIVNGTATFETTPLEAGNYTIDFGWEGDERYFGNSSYAYFTVIKNDADLTITAEPIKEGQDLKVTVTVSDDESGVILISVGDIKDYAQIKDGIAEFTISGLAADTYDITATYMGDKKYNNATSSSQVTVSPKDEASISISPDVVVEDDKQSIEITLPDDATGNVLVEVNGNTFYAEVNGGKVSVPVSGLDANTTYPVTVTYSGNNNYSAATEKGEVTTPEEPVVEQLDPGLKLSVQDTVITVSINDNATGLVIINVGDISFVMNAGELAPVDVSEYLTNGTYDVEVIYLGDELFMNATDSDKVTVPSEPVVEPEDAGLKVDIKDTTVTVSINENATGLVIITVGDISFVMNAGELAPVDVSEFLTNGTYPVTVEYLGDDVFANDTKTGSVTVPSEPVVEPEDAGLKVDIKDTTVTVSINKDATGLVIVSVGDISFVMNAGELAPVDVSEYLTNGTYPVTVEYLGDDVFANDTKTGSVTVPEEPVVEPKDSELKVDIKDTTITVSINDNATGDVIITVGDISFVMDAGELAPVDVADYLGNGTYSVSVKYVGDDVFAEKTLIGGKVTVPSEPVVEPKDSELKVDIKDTTITVSINDNATGDVIITVGDISFVMDAGELAPVDVADYLGNGTYSVSVKYVGDDVFAEKTLIGGKVTVPEEPVVEPKDPNLKATAANATITVSVDKDATGNVLVDVGGNGYYAPVKDGKAVINAIGLDEGSYEATVTYVGDDVFAPANATVTVTVPKKEDPVLQPVDSKADIEVGNETVSIDLPEDATGYVLVDVDGKGYYAPVKDGKASVDLPELDEGNHIVTVTYTGDSKYAPANATETITVDKPIETVVTEDLIKIEKAPDRFVANFTDAEGKALADTKVTFAINGGTYTRTTDANGQASFAVNLPAGNYTMVTTNPVTNETKENTITVLSRFAENRDVTKYFRNATQYVVKVLGDDGNPAAKGEIVTFNINGVFYNRTVNESGYAKLNINLNPDDYIITAEYKGCKVSNNIKVLPILTGKDLTKKFGEAGAFEATLVDGQGKAYANQKVEFNINGVFYSRTTNDDGVARLNINLQPGEYIITSTYGQAAISNKVTVTA